MKHRIARSRMAMALTGATVLLTVLTACGQSGSSSASGGSSSGNSGGDTIAANLVLGAPPEFQTRTDGIPGLEKVYGVTFGQFKKLDAGGPLTINALKNGQVQAADVFTTDPNIPANGWVVLQDPKSLFAAQNVVPLINKGKASATVSGALNAVSAKLTTPILAGLVKKVVLDKGDPETVAKEWLSSNGLG